MQMCLKMFKILDAVVSLSLSPVLLDHVISLFSWHVYQLCACQCAYTQDEKRKIWRNICVQRTCGTWPWSITRTVRSFKWSDNDPPRDSQNVRYSQLIHPNGHCSVHAYECAYDIITSPSVVLIRIISYAQHLTLLSTDSASLLHWLRLPLGPIINQINKGNPLWCYIKSH